MGDQNQVDFLLKHHPEIEGPVLEIGSKQYPKTFISSFRDHVKNAEYIGLDMSAGDGVDIVCDLTKKEDVFSKLTPHYFKTIICLSVLEHIDKPWIAAEHIEQILHPEGTLYIAVPWVWQNHAYPDDYYRFSPNGVKTLFPSIDFHTEFYATNVTGELIDIKQHGAEADIKLRVINKEKKRAYLPTMQCLMLGKKK
ncbi:MAG: methyltransferase domain-containing protein [Alphaproteobacteria bacterium]